MKPHRLTSKNALLVPWLTLSLVLLALGGFIAYSLYLDHGRTEMRERDRLATQAKVIDENISRHLDGVYWSLQDIRKQLPFWSGNNGLTQANHYLGAMSDAMPGVRTFLIVDAKGTIVAANRKEVIGKDISQRDYYQVPLKGQNPSTLYISPPFKTVLGNFVINVSLVIPGPKGGFAGVVSAALDPDYFNILLGSVLYTPDMWATLTHRDGKLFLMMPGSMEEAGLKTDDIFTRHIASGLTASVLSDKVEATGEKRMIALRTVMPAEVPMDKPLIVAVGRDASALHADWRRDAKGKGALFAVLVLSTTLALFLYQRRQRKFDAIAASYEATQRENAERLKLATEAAGVGVWDYNLETGRVTWDDAMFTIFGQDPALFTSTYDDWRKTVLPEDLADAEAALHMAINENRPFNTSYRIRRGDGEERTIRGVARVHLNESGKPVRMIGITEDITEQQQKEEELRRAKEAAVAANAAKSHFLAMVTHEFRTPLSLLTSSTDILDRYGARLTEEKRSEQHGHIRSAARQLSNLIDSVMSFNCLETDSPRISPAPLDVARICRTVAGEVKTAWGSDHDFQVKTTEDCGIAPLDEILFRRVLENLLSNACRYTPSGGHVTLAVDREGDRLLLTVTDSGIGIPEEDQKRIFDAFYRGQNVGTRRGLGLGLSIVVEALKLMGGTIELTSNVGRGTTMRVEIPVVDGSRLPEQPDKQVTDMLSQDTKHLLNG